MCGSFCWFLFYFFLEKGGWWYANNKYTFLSVVSFLVLLHGNVDKNNCYCDFGKYKISEKMFNLRTHTEKKNDRKACNKYKKLIHKLKKTIGNHTPRNTNSNWSPDIQMRVD